MAEQQELVKELINKKRDWSNLAPDIVYLIAKKLPKLLDFTGVHVTCKSWQYSTPLSDYPLCFPWLLEFHQDPKDPISTPTTSLRLYSISCDETITVPVKKCRWIRGTFHNYIPLYDDDTGTDSSTICMFNPLTGDEFAPLHLDNSYRVTRWMALTETGPIHDRRIITVDHANNFNYHNQWAIYDSRQGKCSEEKELCCSFCYCHGWFFSSTDPCSTTKVFDVSSKKLLYNIQPPQEEQISNQFPTGLFYDLWWSRKSYFVECRGEILCVYCYYETDILQRSAFRIYRLVFDAGKQPRWEKISNIGNQILFLEVRNGFSMTATPANGLRGGRIYLIDQFEGRPYVVDVETGTVEAVPCPFKRCTWFVPSLC